MTEFYRQYNANIDTLAKYTEELQRMISTADQLIQENGLYKSFYRGEVDKTFNSQAKIFRDKRLLQEHEVINNAIKLFPNEFDSNSLFRRLAKIQHYSGPTRLLDFTKDPFIALFFACDTSLENDKYKDHDAKVVFFRTFFSKEDSDKVKMLCNFANWNPNKADYVNDLCEGLKRKYDKKSILSIISKDYFVEGNYSNERMKAQQGCFLLMGNRNENVPLSNVSLTLNKYGHSLNESTGRGTEYFGLVSAITIPAQSKPKILSELREKKGISNAIIYRSLESYLRTL